MLSIKTIGGGGSDALSVGAAADYYEKQAEQQRAAQTVPAAGDPARALDEYMLAGMAAAAQPRWWSVEGQLAPNGSPIMPGELRRMLDGQGLDGTQLAQAAKRNQRVGGWDLTFSAPKAVGALWATASAETRAGIMDDMAAAAQAGLHALHERGVFETRRGKDGADREQAADVAAATYPHVTSRAGDPQPHVHAVLVNAGRARGWHDGCARSAENVLLEDVRRRRLSGRAGRPTGVARGRDHRGRPGVHHRWRSARTDQGMVEAADRDPRCDRQGGG